MNERITAVFLLHSEYGVDAGLDGDVLRRDIRGRSAVHSCGLQHDVAIAALEVVVAGDAGAEQLAERAASGVGHDCCLLACVFDSLCEQLIAVERFIAYAEADVVNRVDACTADFVDDGTELGDIGQLDFHVIAGSIACHLALVVHVGIERVAGGGDIAAHQTAA